MSFKNSNSKKIDDTDSEIDDTDNGPSIINFNLLAEVTSPATFQSGQLLTVSNDPVVANNGVYIVHGPDGQPGTSIIPSSVIPN